MTARYHWSGAYRCHLCRQQGRTTRAAIRLFTGVYGYASSAGGWPLCAEHAAEGIESVLHHLVTDPRIDAEKWRVRAYAVDVDCHGDPVMKRLLFVARRRTTALQGDADVRPRHPS